MRFQNFKVCISVKRHWKNIPYYNLKEIVHTLLDPEDKLSRIMVTLAIPVNKLGQIIFHIYVQTGRMQ